MKMKYLRKVEVDKSIKILGNSRINQGGEALICIGDIKTKAILTSSRTLSQERHEINENGKPVIDIPYSIDNPHQELQVDFFEPLLKIEASKDNTIKNNTKEPIVITPESYTDGTTEMQLLALTSDISPENNMNGAGISEPIENTEDTNQKLELNEEIVELTDIIPSVADKLLEEISKFSTFTHKYLDKFKELYVGDRYDGLKLQYKLGKNIEAILGVDNGEYYFDYLYNMPILYLPNKIKLENDIKALKNVKIMIPPEQIDEVLRMITKGENPWETVKYYSQKSVVTYFVKNRCANLIKRNF